VKSPVTGAETITVTLNGEERRVQPGLTVAGLLEGLGLNPALVVVEKNREILERASYEEVPVRDGDVLELVHFVGGG
jgi:thiamine biosynthesis protein ThiS